MTASSPQKQPVQPERMGVVEFRALPKAKRSKYGNKHVVVDGIRFDSQAEAKRWSQLRLLEKSGVIYGLRRQTSYQLPGCCYRSDFDYFETDTGKPITEDVKGVLTAVFKLKAKLFKAQYGREIKVVRS